MKKLTTVALAGAMVAAASFASASATRSTGFGQASLFIGDIQDFQTLPQTVASNPNATYMEFGPQYNYDAYNDEFNNNPGTPVDSSINNPWGGVDMTVGPGVLSVWGNRPVTLGNNLNFGDGFNSTNGGNGVDPGTNFARPRHQVDIIYGMNVSDKLAIGVGINTASNNFDQTTSNTTNPTTKVNNDASDFGISLGADLKELGPLDAVQIGLQWTGAGAQTENNNGTYDNKNSLTDSIINLRVGVDIKGDKGMFQRGELGVNLENGEQKSKPQTAPAAQSWVDNTASWTSLTLGWAMGMSGEKGMGLSGLILNWWGQHSDSPFEQGAYAGSDEAYDWNGTSLTLVSAGEAKVNSWLTSRAGLSETLWANGSYQDKYTNSTTNTTTYKQAYDGNYNTVLTLGLSYNIGDITVDGALNQDLLFNGPFFTNGIPTQLFSQVSATWNWGAGKE